MKVGDYRPGVMPHCRDLWEEYVDLLPVLLAAYRVAEDATCIEWFEIKCQAAHDAYRAEKAKIEEAK